MKTEETKTIKAELLRLQTELLGLQETLASASETVELDQTRMGRLSRMDAMQGQQMALEAGRRRDHELKNIAGALRRIETDDFGYCAECGEDIEAPRLRANPAATHCLVCADGKR